jgi:decaprenylphospho-beta-D-ribofuranose 2-oxidase
MALPPDKKTELTAWSKSVRSSCFVYKAKDVASLVEVLEVARAHGVSVIPHGAGHSYTDAALNTNAIVLDVTPRRQVLSWDPRGGILRVEPGATLRDILEATFADGWWPPVVPSTANVTVGGCAAMNVNGKNSWKVGIFGECILSLDVLLATGELRTITPETDPELFHAFVGSMGLLGIITSITLQLQRISSGAVAVRSRSATCLDEILSAFAEEEPTSDFMEAWLDGFAGGDQLGRGNVTTATYDRTGDALRARISRPGLMDRLAKPVVDLTAAVGRPMLTAGVRMLNRANYWQGRWSRNATGRRLGLFDFNFWPSIALTEYHAMFPEGVETFQAFVPGEHAKEVFDQVLRYSQQQECFPLWCVVKRHRRDPFLLSYQVDGFSLELDYQRTRLTVPSLERVLAQMTAMVVEAGGRFYLAKDRFLTHTQYRESMGREAVDRFLELKKRYDPETLLQSDLYRRVFQPFVS